MNKTLQINEERLWNRLHQAGAVGADPAGGISRFSWEPAYKEGLQLLLRWMHQSGLETRIDTVGNLFVRLEGTDPDAPAVLSGSHFDTVPSGGLFDGLAGVMGALEALLTIKESGLAHKRPLEAVAFINEEATEFLGGTFGSKAICGMIPPDYPYHLKNHKTGQLLSDAMKAFGMGVDPENIPASKIDPARYCAFIEMHIEQGRYLLDHKLPLAIINTIAGIKQFYITIKGVSSHAGGMSMSSRHDAVAGAASVICEVERLASSISPNARGTVGFIHVTPGEHNIIAGECKISVDFREADDTKWQQFFDRLLAVTDAECQKRGLTWTVETTCDLAPAHCSPKIISLLEDTARSLSLPVHQMISFPAHDAMNMSRLMPMGMIFLRSLAEGRSHCPEEFTSRNDLTAGANLLANTLYRIASEDI